MTGIYFLSTKGEIIYIGQTTDWPIRLKQHINQLMVFDEVKFIECAKDKLDELEKGYIKTHKPKYNREFAGKNKYHIQVHAYKKIKYEKRNSTTDI